MAPHTEKQMGESLNIPALLPPTFTYLPPSLCLYAVRVTTLRGYPSLWIRLWSFPNQVLRREPRIVSCQVLNLLIASASVPDENGCLSAISQLLDPSLLPLLRPSAPFPPRSPSPAHFCDGNLSLDTHKVTQTDSQPSTH